MATKTTNYGLNKPDMNDFYDIGVFNDNADIIDAALKDVYEETNKAKGIPIVTTSGTGTAYTAILDGITELADGLKITIIPHTDCSSGIFAFNGKKVCRRKFENSKEYYENAEEKWLKAGVPVTLTYSLKLGVWLADVVATATHTHSANEITAGTFKESVRANTSGVSLLDISQVRNIKAGTEDLIAGESELATGDIYFVYE